MCVHVRAFVLISEIMAMTLGEARGDALIKHILLPELFA